MPAQATAGPSKPSKSPAAILKHIITLESALLADLTDPNPLLPLVGCARHPSPEVVHKAIWALHRVCIPLIAEGHVARITSTSGRFAVAGNGDGDGVGGLGAEEAGKGKGGEEREVGEWVRERLIEYVEILAGLMRDSEAALRSSAVPLLFSLLPPLSATVSSGYHSAYFRIILNSLLAPPPSLRGAIISSAEGSSRNAKIVQDNQVQGTEGVLPADVVAILVDDFWAKYDDLRWLFFKEARNIIQTADALLAHPSNLLAQLHPLTNLPRKPADLNAFYIPSLSTPPKVPSAALAAKKAKTDSSPGKKGKKSETDVDATPAWMEAYDSPSSDDDGPSTGAKRPRERTSRLSILASIHSIPSHINVYTELWLAVLERIPLDEAWTRKVLVGLHGEKGILGHMQPSKRVRVADWLGGLVDRGGAPAMLAMNGLFVLMTEYNLDYPNFYTRLYALLTPTLLHTRYRARFFRLLDTFLRSSLLPAALVASFVKRLARLALSAPPGGIVIVVPAVYGLMKRHVGCMAMLHRYPEDGEMWKDPYNPNDPSPLTSGAIDSSLWELATLQRHYLASISTLAGIFKEQFTKPEFSMEDFLDHGYGTMFETEIKRKIRNPPALAMSLEVPAGGGSKQILFPGLEAAEEERASADAVAQLWAF